MQAYSPTDTTEAPDRRLCPFVSAFRFPVGTENAKRGSPIIPAATVALVPSSMRMKLPVTRLLV